MRFKVNNPSIESYREVFFRLIQGVPKKMFPCCGKFLNMGTFLDAIASLQEGSVSQE